MHYLQILLTQFNYQNMDQGTFCNFILHIYCFCLSLVSMVTFLERFKCSSFIHFYCFNCECKLNSENTILSISSLYHLFFIQVSICIHERNLISAEFEISLSHYCSYIFHQNVLFYKLEEHPLILILQR